MRLSACLSLFILAMAPIAPVAGQSGGTPTSSPAPAASAPGASRDDPDQQIRCRRIAVIGSLIRRERVCKTLAEWRRLQDSGNDTARQQVENGRICAGGQCGGG